MLFNSLQFLIFFPLVTLGFFLLAPRWRWSWLLVASCYFYMCFKPVYILILALTIGVDYIAGLTIERAQGRARRLALGASLLANIGVLVFFKYYGFLAANWTPLADWLGLPALPALNIILPIGLSFHTFQSLAYTIEVYRGTQRAERHLGILATYVMFYPQLVAGPIERPQNLLGQLHQVQTFDMDRVADGLRLMLWGFFKKLVVADRCAAIVNQSYAHPELANGLILLFGTYMFAFQIYCDFSGYSDIARGAARVMGVELMVNFKRPYFSKSISEFWQRWHISLSTWFRDYLYIPLGGNRVGKIRWQWNLFVVFLVSGLWHGANWTFLIWGALHGAYMVVSIWTRRLRETLVRWSGLNRLPVLHRLIQMAITFHLVLLAWVFFRAKSLADALLILKKIFMFSAYRIDLAVFDLPRVELLLAPLAVVFLLAVHAVDNRIPLRDHLARLPQPVRWAIAYAAILSVILFGKYQQMAFIYFQF